MTDVSDAELSAMYGRGLHPDTAARVIEALRAARAQVAALTAEVEEYRNAITWDVTCFNCSNLLDSSYAETVRAEKAEAEVARYRSFCGEALCRDIETDRDALEAQMAALTAELIRRGNCESCDGELQFARAERAEAERDALRLKVDAALAIGDTHRGKALGQYCQCPTCEIRAILDGRTS